MGNNGKALERGVRQVLDALHVGYFRVENLRCFKCGQVQNHEAKGWPDFLCFHNGKMIALEAKSGTGRLTEDQKHWKAMLEMCGVKYFVVHDAQGAVDAIQGKP